VAKSNLAHLGSRPLGKYFSYPKLERIEMDVTLINPPTWTQPAIAEAYIDQPIWAEEPSTPLRNGKCWSVSFFTEGFGNFLGWMSSHNSTYKAWQTYLSFGIQRHTVHTLHSCLPLKLLPRLNVTK